MAQKKEAPSRIADNKKAAYNYFFEEKHEAGIVLEGWEVKAVREGKADANPRKSARTAIGQERVRPARANQLGDHRRQPLGMAAPDDLVPLVQNRAVRAEQRGRAGGGGAFDDQQQEPAPLVTPAKAGGQLSCAKAVATIAGFPLSRE